MVLKQQNLCHASIGWRDGVPWSKRYQDVFFSREDGFTESQYVFLEPNKIAQRFAQLATDTVTIGEIGFGSGLNFFQTWQQWQARPHKKPTQRLIYLACELHPWAPTDLQRFWQQWPRFTPLADQVIDQYPPLLEGIHLLTLSDNVHLLLLHGDATHMLTGLANRQYPSHKTVDAWFLDGFSPRTNPSAWHDALFAVIAKLSNRTSSFASFTAAGHVRRSLQAAGFRVYKTAGYGKKRECIYGHYQGLPFADTAFTPSLRRRELAPSWPLNRQTPLRPAVHHVAIIGAGIAGCVLAASLAAVGFSVHLFDRHCQPMQAASGNRQAVLFAKLAPPNHPSPLMQFHLASYEYATCFYRRVFADAWHGCGMMQLIDKPNQQAAQQLVHAYQQTNLLTALTAEQASARAGIPIEQPVLYYPDSGWIDTQQVAQSTLATERIHWHGNTNILSMSYQHGKWELHSCDSLGYLGALQNTAFVVDAVVLCNPDNAESLLGDCLLPLKAIRGQTTDVPWRIDVASPKTVVCHDGYICPVNDTQQPVLTVGASFDLHEHREVLLRQSQVQNMAKLAKHMSAFADDSLIKAMRSPHTPLTGRVSTRYVTPDYLPLAGPIPRLHDTLTRFSDYRKNARAYLPLITDYHPHAYVLTGLGSKGFTSAPLLSQLLVSELTQSLTPLSTKLRQHLHPGRFAIRQLAGRKS